MTGGRGSWCQRATRDLPLPEAGDSDGLSSVGPHLRGGRYPGEEFGGLLYELRSRRVLFKTQNRYVMQPIDVSRGDLPLP
jgi:hypothetical protein